MRFENKTAVVTGGSRGIGLAIATKLAKEGANIAILYVGDENEGIKAKEELLQYGTKVEQYFCDVSNFEESKKVVNKVIEDFGSIEILVNNAGITRDKLVLNMDEKDFDAVINVNLKGTFNMIKHTYKHFMKKRYGRICSTASIVGLTATQVRLTILRQRPVLSVLQSRLQRSLQAEALRLMQLLGLHCNRYDKCTFR